jgi:hypothetical protein
MDTEYSQFHNSLRIEEPLLAAAQLRENCRQSDEEAAANFGSPGSPRGKKKIFRISYG